MSVKARKAYKKKKSRFLNRKQKNTKSQALSPRSRFYDRFADRAYYVRKYGPYAIITRAYWPSPHSGEGEKY